MKKWIMTLLLGAAGGLLCACAVAKVERSQPDEMQETGQSLELDPLDIRMEETAESSSKASGSKIRATLNNNGEYFNLGGERSGQSDAMNSYAMLLENTIAAWREETTSDPNDIMSYQYSYALVDLNGDDIPELIRRFTMGVIAINDWSADHPEQLTDLIEDRGTSQTYAGRVLQNRMLARPDNPWGEFNLHPWLYQRLNADNTWTLEDEYVDYTDDGDNWEQYFFTSMDENLPLSIDSRFSEGTYEDEKIDYQGVIRLMMEYPLEYDIQWTDLRTLEPAERARTDDLTLQQYENIAITYHTQNFFGIIPYAVGRKCGYTLQEYYSKTDPSNYYEKGLDSIVSTDPTNYVRAFSGSVLMNLGSDGIRGTDYSGYADNIGFKRTYDQVNTIFLYDSGGDVIREYELTYDDQGRLLEWNSDLDREHYKAIYADEAKDGPESIIATSGDDMYSMTVSYDEHGCISEIYCNSEEPNARYQDIIYSYRPASQSDLPLYY